LVVANFDELPRRALWDRWHCLSEAPVVTPALTLQALRERPQRQLNPRGGRWPGLVAMGARLAADPTPASLQLFEPPAAIGSRMVRQADGSTKSELFDPEAERPGRGVFKRLVGALRHPTPDEILDGVPDVRD
jgi:hypothetical protein